MSRTLAGLVSRFGIVGLVATVVYLIVSNVLILIGQAPVAASVFGYLVGMAISFLGQSKFTFGVERTRQHHLLRFCALSAIGLVLSYAAVGGVSALGLPPAVGTAVTAILIPPISFLAMKLWVFRETI